MVRRLAIVVLASGGCSLVFAPSTAEEHVRGDASIGSGDGSQMSDANNPHDAAPDAEAPAPDASCPEVSLTLVVSSGGAVSAKAQDSGPIGSCGPGPTGQSDVCTFCAEKDVTIELTPFPEAGFDFVGFNLACGNSQFCNPTMEMDFTAGAQFASLR